MADEIAVPDLTPASTDTAGGVIVSAAQGLLASTVRTFVPLLVGWVVAVFAFAGVTIESNQAETLVTGIVSVAVALLYYLLVRVLEIWKSSKFGWLLGFANSPLYGKTSGSSAELQAAVKANVQAG